MSGKIFYPLLLLIIPLIGMKFTDQINWNLSDFFLSAIILLSFSLIANFIIQKINNKNTRIFSLTIIIIFLILVWAELAVGIFGSVLAGS